MSRISTRLGLALTLAFAIQVSELASQEPSISGDHWLSMPELFRPIFLLGMVHGSQGVGTDVIEILASDSVPNPQLMDLLLRLGNSLDSVSGGKRMNVMLQAEQMTLLYRDPANRSLGFWTMAKAARLRLDGASTEELERYLTSARRIRTGSGVSP